MSNQANTQGKLNYILFMLKLFNRKYFQFSPLVIIAGPFDASCLNRYGPKLAINLRCYLAA